MSTYKILSIALLSSLYLITGMVYAMHHSKLFQHHSVIHNISTIKNLSSDADAQLKYSDAVQTLISNTTNAYTASLPLMASAALGDRVLYTTSLTTMLRSLHNLNENPLPAGSDTNHWMENNAFKAWMWGRVLLSADSMNDEEHVNEAKQKLTSYLNAPRTADDSPAFIAWARAYLASLNHTTYASQKNTMLKACQSLSETYVSTKTHDDLSNALWAWVMVNQAAALSHDNETYEKSLHKMTQLTNTGSVMEALNQGLQRTSASNDYPAWAMAIVYLAATRMGDHELTAALLAPLTTSITEAENADQLAESTLANLNVSLAKLNTINQAHTIKPGS